MVKVVDEAEIQRTFAVPAVYSNRFVLTVGGVVRLSFGEQVREDSETVYRHAIALSLTDAIELKNLLVEMLRAPEKAAADFAARFGGTSTDG